MKYLNNKILKKYLTFLSLILISLTSCTVLDITDNDNTCKNHANIKLNIKKYVNQRYSKKNLTRLGIFPFSVPANFSSRGLDKPDFGVILAQKLQSSLLYSNIFSTVEMLNLSEWPGKKDEFFSNNLTAIDTARNIGLDFIAIGYLSSANSITSSTVYSKIIDVHSGQTIFYGETTAFNKKFNSVNDESFLSNFSTNSTPSNFKIYELTDTLMTCHSKMILR